MKKQVIEIFSHHRDVLNRRLPMADAVVQAGFPSPANDYIEKALDLNELMVQHPAATFFVRVDGDSMIEAGIQSGDTLVVDRSVEPVSGKIVVAVVNGDFTVKRLIQKGKQVTLCAESPHFSNINIDPESDFEVWGVVTYVIHKAT